MAASRVYLDENASAPLLDVARAAMLAGLDAANPSSVHAEGRAARMVLEGARADVARLAGVSPSNVVFTSGATEAASMLLSPNWRMGRSPLAVSHLFVSTSDHPCLLSGGQFSTDAITTIGVDSNGIVRLDELARCLDSHDRDAGLPMVAFHGANNETGVIQPISDVAERVRAAGGILVVDAVQMAGRIDLAAVAAMADFLILSAHKLGGPKGVGAIIGRSDVMMPAPLVRGGGQERGFRAGTESIAGIAGFGAAANAVADWQARSGRMLALRERIEARLRAIDPLVEIHGQGALRLPNTVFFSIPGLKAETAQIALDLAGFAVSAGSACSSGKVGPSHVLKAMGLARPDGALRVSVGPANTNAEVDRFGDALEALIARTVRRDRAA